MHYGVTLLQNFQLFKVYSSIALLFSQFSARLHKEDSTGFHMPSLQNMWFTRGKSIFSFDGLQAIFRGLKLIQLWAANSDPSPASAPAFQPVHPSKNSI